MGRDERKRGKGKFLRSFPSAGMKEEEGKKINSEISCFLLSFSGLHNGNILMWTPLEEKEKNILITPHTIGVRFLSFSPDGKFLASVDRVYKLIIWSTEVKIRNETLLILESCFI
jgi:WD40 repeat protein